MGYPHIYISSSEAIVIFFGTCFHKDIFLPLVIYWIDHAMDTPSGVPSSGLGLILFIVYSFFCISGRSAVSADTVCYTGSGNVSTDFPCDLSQDISFCCGTGWSCLSNGLCQYRTSTLLAEGTCTDKTSPASSCLGICLASMLQFSSYLPFGFFRVVYR